MLGLFAATPASVGLWAECGWCEGLQHPSVAALCCSCPAVVMEGGEAGGMQPAKCRDQPLLHSSLAPPQSLPKPFSGLVARGCLNMRLEDDL